MPQTQKADKSTLNPLLLLRQIRDVMAQSATAQKRLDALVKVIARGFSSEVCSIYLQRAGDVLELFANEGLNPSSVHLTRLQVGEGLVGEIAALGETLNLAKAQLHPKYAYRPETGEEIYHSFLGVPILHSSKVMGVLVVQSKLQREFSEEQIEVLRTVAMVLAELAASGQLVSLTELSEGSGSALLTQHVHGIKLAPGLARAPAVLHQPRIEIKRVIAEDPAAEERRLKKAVAKLQESVDVLIESTATETTGEARDIMESYKMFTHDEGWYKQIVEAVHSGLTAEAAVKKVQEQLHQRMSQVTNDYIRERIHDLENLSLRLLQILAGVTHGIVPSALPPEFILVARSLGPADLLEYSNHNIKGLILEEGSGTSHVIILARAMDIPAVGKIPEVTGLIQSGEMVIVNGDLGDIYIRPTEEIDNAVKDNIRVLHERTEAYAATQHLPAVSKDQVKISLNLNVGLLVDNAHLKAQDVDGIGLYRTELPYMTSASFPSVEVQVKTYAKVVEQSEGKRVIFRSFDIGGDKQVPYLHIEPEENPAMGWRATRIGLDRPSILRRQFRALLLSAGNQTLHVMFPFIAEVEEFHATKQLFQQEARWLKDQGNALPKQVRMGAMIEIPSILFQLDSLLPHLDFVSIGSNDLLQFLFACDRGTARMAERYDALSPVVLRVLKFIAERCRAHNVDVGFCGEIARRPLEAMALIGAGIHTLSMPISSIGPVKAMIRSVEVKDLENFVTGLCESDAHSVRNRLMDYARDHRIIL